MRYQPGESEVSEQIEADIETGTPPTTGEDVFTAAADAVTGEPFLSEDPEIPADEYYQMTPEEQQEA